MDRHDNTQKIIVPTQPSYLAWPGYFARLLGADELVLMDDVQFVRSGWHHRNHIWDPAVGRRMMTIPVKKKGRYDQRINEVEIASSDWGEKHLRLLRQAYPEIRDGGRVATALEAYYGQNHERFSEAAEAFIAMALDLLGIDIQVTRSSDLGVTGMKTERLINLCRATGSHVMRMGPGSLNYVDFEMLSDAGVELEILRSRQESPAPAESPTEDMDLSRLSILDTVIRHGDESRRKLEGDYRLEKTTAIPEMQAAH